MKLFKIITIGAIILLITILAGLSFQYYKQSKLLQESSNNLNGPKKIELNLKGIVKKGKDIDPQKSYCPNGIYIVTTDKTYQLRTPDDLNEKASTAYAMYRDAEVALTAKFQDISPNCGSVKNCGCDEFVLVEKIEKTKDTPSSFNSYNGRIVCLPLVEGNVNSANCALGLATDDGKYYILEDVPDSLIVEGNDVKITGELVKEKTATKYRIDGVINVVEVK